MRKTTQTYTFNDHSIRVIFDQGEPWFVAQDVARALGYSRPDVTISQRFKNQPQLKVRTRTGIRSVMVLSEAETIDFAEDSWASEAEAFEKWLHAELLPALHNQPANQAPAAKTLTVQGAPEITHPIQHAEEKPMSAISLFNFDGAGVRIVDQNGDPWFVAKDVCDVLGITNSRDAVSSLDEDEKAGVAIIDTNSKGVSQQRTITIISEAGVSELIFKSRKPDAKRFKRWLKHEVLPSIRKTGSYTLDRQAHLREALYDVPSLQFLVHECTVKIQELQDEVAENQPKLEVYHRIAHADGSLCLTDAAKALQVAPNDLITWMSDNRWIYKRTPRAAWVGYQRQMNRGLLEHKVVEVGSSSRGLVEIAGQVRVTPQGLDVFSKRMND